MLVACYTVIHTLCRCACQRYKTVECFQNVTHRQMLQVELTHLWTNETFVLGYNWTQNLLRSIIPLLVLLVLNISIVNSLRRTRKVVKRKDSRHHRVNMMMMMVIVVFMVCVTPDAIMSTVFGLGYIEASNPVRGIREFTDTLLTLNAAVNFIIYCLFNRLFLSGCKGLFCGRTKSRQKQTDICLFFGRMKLNRKQPKR